MTTTITVVSGNPRPGSRTLGVAEALARRLADALPDATVAAPIELAGFAGELFAAEHPRADEALARLAEPGLALIATPAYKGAYTGLLKAFLDLYPAGALGAVVAVPVVVAGAPAHAVTTDLHLQPVLRELGAALPVAALTVTEAQLGDPGPVIERWASRGAVDRLARLVAPAA
ncbi:MAG TPA: NAD(P)H-dependent oxidoreductase [Microlunatus sp.]|nr:NAD(P)H-dependent oxidoreductase [Microlunatus sp.]